MRHTIDTAGWTQDQIAQVRSEAVFSGYDVLEDGLEDILIVEKPKPMVRRKPKMRFTG